MKKSTFPSTCCTHPIMKHFICIEIMHNENSSVSGATPCWLENFVKKEKFSFILI